MRSRTTVCAKFWGEYALFTRPEGKVERVTYPVMTPSAARGLLESLLWKPEIKYEIRSIAILNKPEFHSIVRNEVEQKANIQKGFMNQPKDVFTDDSRQLRHSLILRNPSYLVEADIVLQPNANDPIEKYEAMFTRRLRKGQCFHRPYFGTREFSAHFGTPDKDDRPIVWTDSLGTMFFDFRYASNGSMMIPYFFDAVVENGVLTVPTHLYEEVNR